MFVNFNILNQLGSPAINSNTFANRPAAGQTGRLFVSTDTFEIYRDNGTTWDLIGGPGSSTITGTGTATQVAYFTSSQAIGSSTNLFWDNTNTRLGVGTATPGYTIEANGDVKADRLYITGMVAGNGVVYHNPTINAVTIANYNASGIVRFETNGGIPQMNIDTAGALSLGNGNTAADTSSILDIGSTTRGFLQPRMTTAQRNLIATPATGLTVYNTSSNTIDYYNGTSWISLSTTTGTVTGTGTATQVAFWSASSTISGSNNLYWDNVTGSLGVNTNTPGAELDVHGTGVIVQLNSTSATANSLLAFQRSGSGLWRIGDTYNGGNNFFELHNTVLTSNAIEVLASSNETTFVSSKTYSSGNAIGLAVRHNLTIPNGTNVGLSAIGGVNSNLNLTLGGSTTVANTGRQGLEGSTSINFTGAGTLTMTQGTTVRAFSALSSVYAFNGSAVGTITHLAGLRICFPDNVGSAVNITNNYALLINDQTTGTGTVTYTNRWGIYQEGSSDLNYFAANTLIGTTTNSGQKLVVSGTSLFNGNASYNNGQNIIYSSFDDVGALFQRVGTYGAVIRLGRSAVTNSTTIDYPADATFAVSTASIERIRITSGGDLGINTTTPEQITTYRVLQITGGTTSTGGIFTTTNSDSTIKARFLTNGSEAVIGTVTNSPFYSITNDTIRGGFSSGGNFLIGTTTDAGYKLQVNGTISGNNLRLNNGGSTLLEMVQPGFYTYNFITNNDNLAFRVDSTTVVRFYDTGNIENNGSIKTGGPTGGTAAAWKFGSRVAAVVALDATQYIELDVGGTLYKLAIVT